MRFTRPVFVAAVALALSAPPVWAVEGDIVFERKARPESPAPSAEEPAEADSKEPERKPDEDVIPESEAKFYAPATFPHWTHIIRYRCFVCHPRIYPMEVGTTPLFGIEHHKEKSCGRCHNGRNAFDTSFTACGRCHTSQGEQ